MTLRIEALALGLLIGGAACARAPGSSSAPPCPAVSLAGAPADARAWAQLLLDQPGDGLESLDCAGQPGVVPQLDAPAPGCEHDVHDVDPSRRLGPDDLTVAPIPDGRSLVWVRTAHFSDGYAGGPLALVELAEDRLTVHAIGPLLAPSSAVRLEFRLQRELRFDDQGAPLLHEHLTIRDLELGDPTSARLVAERSLDRPLTRDGRILRAPDRARAQHTLVGAALAGASTQRAAKRTHHDVAARRVGPTTAATLARQPTARTVAAAEHAC